MGAKSAREGAPSPLVCDGSDYKSMPAYLYPRHLRRRGTHAPDCLATCLLLVPQTPIADRLRVISDWADANAASVLPSADEWVRITLLLPGDDPNAGRVYRGPLIYHLLRLYTEEVAARRLAPLLPAAIHEISCLLPQKGRWAFSQSMERASGRAGSKLAAPIG